MSHSSSKRSFGIVLVAVLIVGAFLTWYVVVPRVVLVRLATAISSGDHEVVSRHIDYPLLRESLREETVAMMRARAATEGPGAVIGASVAEAVVGPLIDRMVTPEGVRDLMRGGEALGRVLPRDAIPQSSDGPPDFRIRGQGLTEVHAIMEGPAGEFRLVFRRTAVSLRLVGVRLPR